VHDPDAWPACDCGQGNHLAFIPLIQVGHVSPFLTG
jgi:hypothetical protein